MRARQANPRTATAWRVITVANLTENGRDATIRLLFEHDYGVTFRRAQVGSQQHHR